MKHQVDFLELLQIDYEKYPVIAVVGGGGKTSLIYRLTDELIDKGKRVIITTTTHMAGESELPNVFRQVVEMPLTKNGKIDRKCLMEEYRESMQNRVKS